MKKSDLIAVLLIVLVICIWMTMGFATGKISIQPIEKVHAERPLSISQCLNLIGPDEQIAYIQLRYYRTSEFGDPYVYDTDTYDHVRIGLLVDTEYSAYPRNEIAGEQDLRMILYNRFAEEMGRVMVWRIAVGFHGEYNYLIQVRDVRCLLYSETIPTGY